MSFFTSNSYAETGAAMEEPFTKGREEPLRPCSYRTNSRSIWCLSCDWSESPSGLSKTGNKYAFFRLERQRTRKLLFKFNNCWISKWSFLLAKCSHDYKRQQHKSASPLSLKLEHAVAVKIELYPGRGLNKSTKTLRAYITMLVVCSRNMIGFAWTT